MTGKSFPIEVEARLPDNIARLAELGANFWYSWHRATRQLVFMLDPELYWRVDRNPRVFLRCVDQRRLDNAAANETFLGLYSKVLAEFDTYLEQGLDGYAPAQLEKEDLVAYFCAEFGYHESFPIYSGGLGILAGDHCKTASDMRLPFVAVGLLYRSGYFKQLIDRHGNQLVEHPYLKAGDGPVETVKAADGSDLYVTCPIKGTEVAVKVWRARVGRVPVLLLDTDIPENSPEHQKITRVLYDGGKERRIEQEIVLGIAGVRALLSSGMQPRVWHINEGHAAFQGLERIRVLVAGGLDYDAALEAVAASTVFTTHTPVAAGHDVFDRDLVLSHFHGLISELGTTQEQFLRLGENSDGGHDFNMTRLAISTARSINAVSRMHGQVSADICASAWPDVPPRENPVGYVTNGVHVPTFMERGWTDLLEQEVGPAWSSQLIDRSLAKGIEELPDTRYWNVSQRVKSNMLTSLRRRLERQYERNGISEAHIHRLLKYLDPEDPNVLTVGFARRFATYKRATLLFQDLGWLQQLVDKDDRPVVFVFAGKAHPADEPGQALLRRVHEISHQAPFVGKIIMVEGYDMGLGRLLTAGVDVWLNTPIAPMEASGTSGMKAAINGTVNLSVLDGWWAEAYDGTNGWGMPPSAAEDPAERDREDARTLYETLQDEVIPLYYDRNEKLGHSPGWVERCKRSMATVLPHFNTRRFLNDYAVGFYGPACRQGKVLGADNFAVAKDLAQWKRRVREAWPAVTLSLLDQIPERMPVDGTLTMKVQVELGGLQPEDVRVECIVHRDVCSEESVPIQRFAHYGEVKDGVRELDGDLIMVTPFEPQAGDGDTREYRLDMESPWTGQLRCEIRAVPSHPHLAHPYEMGLMRWL
jgi:starch phosphorylase